MKATILALLLSVACLAQSRQAIFYNCEPMPTLLTYAVYDCAGNFVSVSSAAPTMPCRGYDVCTVPAGVTGRLDMVAWVWSPALGRYVVVASNSAPLGCP